MSTIMIDTVTPAYYAMLYQQGRLTIAALDELDELGEADINKIRAIFKAETFAWRIVGDALGQQYSRQLEELTAYMRRRFPKRGSTPPCAAVMEPSCR